jgi:tight adherence protein B
MDILYYGFALLVFIAAALAIEAIYGWWFSTQSRAARRLSQRLDQVKQHRSGSADAPAEGLYKNRKLARSSAVAEVLRQVPGIHALDKWLQQSGTDGSVGRLLMQAGLAFGIGFVLSLLLFFYFLVALVVGLVCAGIPFAIIWSRREERLIAFEKQLPEAADLISRSLKAGHALSSTLTMLADELPDPIAAEFRIVSDEINFGMPMSEALQRLAERVPLTDLRYMIVAILIQREAGGNLSEIMTNVSLLIRQRLKLLGDIRTMSAEGRLSAWILCLLPIAIATVFFMVSPDYLKQFFDDPAGPLLLGGGAGMMLLGVLWMRQLIRIRV